MLAKPSILALFQICFTLQFSAAASIEKKLNHQFAIFDSAQEYIINAVGHKGGTVIRRDWDQLLTPSSEYQLTEIDLNELVKKQKLERENNKLTYQRQSAINLDLLRKNPKLLLDFCRRLPKGGMLHVHLSGTTDRKTARKFLDQYNPRISHEDISERLKNLVDSKELEFLKHAPEPKHFSELRGIQEQINDLFILPKGNNHPFSRFVALFVIRDLVKTTENSQALSEEIVKDFLVKAKRQNVTYVEFTNEPGADYPINQEELPRLEHLVKQWEKTFGIVVRFNYSFFRLLNPEENRQRAKKLLELKSRIITGIDLVGDETHTPALEQGQAIYATVASSAKRGLTSLQMTMHAGELGDDNNPRDALLLGATRIGHGVKLRNNPVILEYAKRKQLGVEVNLISNLRLGVIDELRNHPFLDYIRMGLRTSLSTDDEGMLETDIDQEFYNAILHSDISYAEIKLLVLNSIDTAFVDSETKNQLRKRLIKSLTEFEKSWIKVLPKKSFL